MMEKRNLKRAIAKFEELANDEDYEGLIYSIDLYFKIDLIKRLILLFIMNLKVIVRS